MMNGVSRPARRSATKHRAILDAAAACVAGDGYAAATIEGIAAEAGVGKQTIYRWWPSKAALFVEVYAHLVDREAITSDPLPAREALASMLRKVFEIFRVTPAGAILAGLIAEAASNDVAREALERGLVHGRADLVGGIVAAGNERGETAASAEIVADVVAALVWKQLVLRPQAFDDAFARRLADIAFEAGRQGHDA